MENHLKRSIVLAIITIVSLCLTSRAVSVDSSTNETSTTFLEPILTKLGFQELAKAVPFLSDSASLNWNGSQYTLFAPSDSSIRSCGDSCSVPQLLREHIVPGTFSIYFLRKLDFFTKLETMSPGRCVTITSAKNILYLGDMTIDSINKEFNRDDDDDKIIYVDGVEITGPEVFFNSHILIHRLEGFVTPLSSFSCNIASLSFPEFSLQLQPLPQPQLQPQPFNSIIDWFVPSYITMFFMFIDIAPYLEKNGFFILSVYLGAKSRWGLIGVKNVTIFALDDYTIDTLEDIAFFSGEDVSSMKTFHIVPNQVLMRDDLLKLPVGTMLPTLDPDQNLFITSYGGPLRGEQMSINYIEIKSFDVVYNRRFVVHSVYSLLPSLKPPLSANYINLISDNASEMVGHSVGIFENGRGYWGKFGSRALGYCAAFEKNGTCSAINLWEMV
ncbi:hypothetical protein GIB67_009515 [Kingdonia uniflora]|uniref:FAS1 domain-containing protein n=1 Tax=Kingdonia uniflora TaxID=39325 RepID=A0A7J7NWQ9_9MAGN|nr:hypothetical protein GIB67_009515 [Kingdonia uniflora]